MNDQRPNRQAIAARHFWTGASLLSDAVLTIEGGAITAISTTRTGTPVDMPVDLPIDLHVDLLMPGLVNAHSHAFQRAFRGWVQRGRADDDFFSWRAAMYATALQLPPEGVAAIARLCFVEMAQAGVVAVGEFHYLHHQPDGTPYDDPDELAKRVIEAAREVGIRIVLLRCAYAAGGIGKLPLRDQRRFIDRDPQDVLAAAQRLSQFGDERVTSGIAPHSVRAVPQDWLVELAQWPGVIHAHVAEQRAEVEACWRAHGCSPLALLAGAGLVDERFTAVHLTHPDDGDIARMLGAGATLCACPSTELDLGDGFLPLEARRALPLCIGTDSHARIDLFDEARALELHGRGLAGRRLVLAASEQPQHLAEVLLKSATTIGRRALGLADGPLKVGSAADLCALDLDRPAAFGVPPLCAAVFGASPRWVTDVWVAGQHVVKDGRDPLAERAMRQAEPWMVAR